MSTSECQVLGCLQGNWLTKFPVWISKDEALWVCYGAQGKRLSQICSSNFKGWSSDAIANSRPFVYCCASIACPSRNFENSQFLLNSTELQTNDITEVVNNSGNEASSLMRTPFVSASMLTSRYRAVWGHAVRGKKSGDGCLRQSGLCGGTWDARRCQPPQSIITRVIFIILLQYSTVFGLFTDAGWTDEVPPYQCAHRNVTVSTCTTGYMVTII